MQIQHLFITFVGIWVANKRRKRKGDNAFKTKEKCAKLIGNSAYGSTILKKEKIQSTKICNETDFQKIYIVHLYNIFKNIKI